MKSQTAQMTGSGQRIYDNVNSRAIALAEEVLKDYDLDDIVIEAMADALRDAAPTIITDAKLLR